jgi:nucleotide-binding universal stress UspA family protein
MTPIRTILHPTDFSPYSDYAFQVSCSLARDHGARIMVLHVQERPLLVYAGVMTPPPPPPDAEERKALLKRLQLMQPADSRVPVEHLLEEGDPATAIVQIARDWACDLIVMGSHGRTGLRRVLMGSVAEHVVREAPCPVLTVNRPTSSSCVPVRGSASAISRPRENGTATPEQPAEGNPLTVNPNLATSERLSEKFSHTAKDRQRAFGGRPETAPTLTEPVAWSRQSSGTTFAAKRTWP